MDRTTLTLANTLAYLDGEPQYISPEETEIASDLVGVLSDCGCFQNAIDQLCLRGALSRTMHPGGEACDVYRMDAGTRAMYKQSSLVEPQHGMLQALLLVLHAFPVDVYLDPE